MINEKVAPELLEYDAPLVASIEAQLEHQVYKPSTALHACILQHLAVHSRMSAQSLCTVLSVPTLPGPHALFILERQRSLPAFRKE